MGCLGENTIADLVAGELRVEARADVSAHLAACADCRGLVATLAPGVDLRAATPVRARHLTNTAIHDGRYVLERVLGEGGMGVVYRAYDAQLRRAIALKLIRSDLRAKSATKMRERLLREAQAMAQLNHPNVVTVYDVGVDDEQVFVAMELVDGETLKQWSTQVRTHADIVRVLAQAGLGLAAAHAAGMVHRDFKPDNVLVRTDGRVQVSDFGLARKSDDSEQDVLGDAAVATPLTQSLTATGALAGTPAYMAPEQWSGARATAASDQYAFCQVAWELIYGERPHAAAQDATELVALIATGEGLRVPAGTTVPAAVYAVLRRGLSIVPSNRFPDMSSLLAALTDAFTPPANPVRRSSRTIWIAAAGLTVATAITATILATSTRGPASASSAPAPETRTEPAPTTRTATATAIGSETAPAPVTATGSATAPATATATAPATPTATGSASQPAAATKPSSPPPSATTTAAATSKPTSRPRTDRTKPTQATSMPSTATPPTKSVDRTDAVMSDPWGAK